jgi:hypothetical protein
MQLMAAIGAILAGLFMLARQAPGLIIALRTGVLVSKSYGAKKILRADDEARFRQLWRMRARDLGLPLIVLLVGLIYLVLTLRAITATSA